MDLSTGEYFVDFPTLVDLSYAKQIGNKIYALDGKDYMAVDWRLVEYDYAEDRWENTEPRINGNGAAALKSDVIYHWDAGEIDTHRLSDGATQNKVNISDDIEVLDLRPLPGSPNNLLVTSDERYVFYDGSAKTLRMIYKAEEA